MIRYLSLCSGIEAFSCAVKDMPEFQPYAFSEIDPFPCKVLQHHYPLVPNLGDMTKIDGSIYHGAIQLVVGGTPCQDFSVAGRRKGLAGERSGLALKFVELVASIRPRWILWENVPGAFSTNGGRDFATFTAAMAECGYHLCWRVLDAQYFGVPQRRRRIFLVGHFASWRAAAAVLFERESLRGDTTKSKKTGKEIAKYLTRGIGTRLDSEIDTFVVGYDSINSVPTGNISATLTAHGCCRAKGPRVITGTLNASGAGTSRPAGQGNELDFCVPVSNAVRRLTPMESERLQGFPDNYTNIPGASDTARYKALGNSMCVNVMRWIAKRMLQVDNQLPRSR